MMKKCLWNPPDSQRLVRESLEGLVAAVPHLSLMMDEGVRVVLDNARKNSADSVAVVSGGGSGHEPAQAGFVGRGMLAAAVCGDVFASPNSEAILAAIHHLAPSPVVLLVTNYTGDRLAFGIAAERARAAGLKVEMVVIDDDVAIDHPGIAGRRGIAGTMLVIKAAGAAAAAGKTLEEVADAARRAASSVATLGVALDVCSVPGAPPSTRLGPGDVEIGLGIHGEPGYENAPWAPLDDLVQRMLRRLLSFGETGDEGAAAHAALNAPGAPLALLVNNLGGTSNLELHAVARRALAWLRSQGLNVARVYTGACVTSLDMAGVSLSLMACDDAMLGLLDADTAAIGWPSVRGAIAADDKATLPLPPAIDELRRKRAALMAGRPLDSATAEGRVAEAAVRAAAAALLAAADELNRLDAAAGDGDTGSTVATASRALMSSPEGVFAGSASDTLASVAATLASAIGGSLGGLLNLGLTAASAALPSAAGQASTPKDWAAALAAGCSAVERYGRARAGSRTMLDALLPASEALSRAAQEGATPAAAARAAAAAAAAGADATKGMAAQAGRASYTRGAALADADPGAVAASLWMDAVAATLEKSA